MILFGNVRISCLCFNRLSQWHLNVADALMYFRMYFISNFDIYNTYNIRSNIYIYIYIYISDDFIVRG